MNRIGHFSTYIVGGDGEDYIMLTVMADSKNVLDVFILLGKLDISFQGDITSLVSCRQFFKAEHINDNASVQITLRTS